jgi:hypothetical protein
VRLTAATVATTHTRNLTPPTHHLLNAAASEPFVLKRLLKDLPEPRDDRAAGAALAVDLVYGRRQGALSLLPRPSVLHREVDQEHGLSLISLGRSHQWHVNTQRIMHVRVYYTMKRLTTTVM